MSEPVATNRGRCRLARCAPHSQIAVLAVLTVVGLAALAGTIELRTERLDAASELSVARYLPASQALGEVDALNRATDRGTLLLASSSHGRISGLATVGAEIEKLPPIWAEYRRASLKLPGEEKLAQDFIVRRTAYLKSVFRYVGVGSVAPADVMSALRSSSQVQAADLDGLRSLYLAELGKQTIRADHQAGLLRRDTWFVDSIVVLVLCVAFGLVLRWTRARERDDFAAGQERASEMRRTDLETRLQRALEMVKDEGQSYLVIQDALGERSVGDYSELLVADSSRAHFTKVASTDRGAAEAGCGVTTPADCPAASRGQTRSFASSSRLDACPLLRGRAAGACSALCVPVSIAGKTVGVVHATGPDEDLPSSDSIATLELIARKTGEHVGMLRAFARSETQAQTDALTGLLNRRSLEDQARELTEAGEGYVVAYCDLDHFKQLNDVYGHDAGDRALRLFSRVLRDNVRPNDLPARYGGEEFVIVLPDCAVLEATGVVDRIQTRLADALQGGTVPPFTASFGIARSNPSELFGQTVESADAALRSAKAAGRNRWILAGDEPNVLADRESAEPELAS